ncbi:MAG TPA: hypothetical protein VGB77_14870 [Abditibacteriaceae bacterium]
MRIFIFFLFCLLTVMPVLAETVQISVQRDKPESISNFEAGVTHTQYSLDSWGDQAAIERAKALLKAGARFQNQHIMGWGAGNPEPSPGVYDWSRLDERLKIIRESGGTPVITLCGAPDWMKGGQSGQTDWTKLETAPLPEHYQDFANLAAQVARRYPNVRHFQVWNEMKGFWDAKANNWNYQNYTRLYNLCYDALKAVNPQIKVGGPYLVIEGTGSQKGDWSAEKPIRARQWEILDYWLKNKRGADFITLDRGIKDFHDKHNYSPAELMALTPFFGDIIRQIRTKTDLPIWWAEFYGASGASREYAAANYASCLLHSIKAGLNVALLWEPQDAGKAAFSGGLFSDTRKTEGGQALLFYDVYKALHECFSKGTPLFKTQSTSPMVEALASDKHVLLINKSEAPVTVEIEGRSSTLKAYEVKLL